ncbi:DUF6518 family protein [Streptacidiphilus neutrinimicus]|uniref:DUF6518 family protein n=1 Tax=Streptacidiphilus neutrinimicus TaxID=105420 RepID=UPI00157B3ACC|nr:DUF6518 family protein [Streptacidiphilus neutrinimicus]
MDTTLASPVATPIPRTVRSAWIHATATAFGAGLGLGVLTNLAQGWLPGAWNQLANSGSVWSVFAFVAGALLARRTSLPTAAVAGLCTEAGLVVGYYGYAQVGRHGMGSLAAPLVWLGMAFVAGPLFGVAGGWWCGRDARRRIVAVAALAGVFGMEGIQYAWVLHYATEAWACAAVVMLVPLLMLRTFAARGLALLTALPLSCVAYFVFMKLLLHAAIG